MAVVSVREFAGTLRGLDETAFSEFVRELLAARGHDVDSADERTVLASDGDRQRAFLLYHPGRFRIRSPTPPDRSVDVVVTSRRDDDRARALAADLTADLIDAGDLYHTLLYALDRETATEVARTHLGRPLSTPERSIEDESTTDTAGERLKSVVDRPGQLSRPGGWQVLAAVAVLVAVLTAAMVGTATLDGFDTSGVPGGVGASDGGDAPGPGREAGGDLSVTPAPSRAVTSTPEVRLGRTNQSLRVLPPGLDESGISDADELADAHERALSNRSYRWVVTYEEFVDGQPSGAVRETVTVERPRVYTVDIERRGDPTLDPLLFADTEAYADGEHRYEPIRVSGSRDDVRTAGLGFGQAAFADRAATYIEWYLSVSRSSIADVREAGNRTQYLIETAGDPYPGAENARASAVVDSEGMVHRLRSERELPNEDVRMVVTFRYTAIGNATVSPPAWYATNVSNGTTTTTAPRFGDAASATGTPGIAPDSADPTVDTIAVAVPEGSIAKRDTESKRASPARSRPDGIRDRSNERRALGSIP